MGEKKEEEKKGKREEKEKNNTRRVDSAAVFLATTRATHHLRHARGPNEQRERIMPRCSLKPSSLIRSRRRGAAELREMPIIGAKMRTYLRTGAPVAVEAGPCMQMLKAGSHTRDGYLQYVAAVNEGVTCCTV